MIRTSGFSLVGVIRDIRPHVLSVVVKQALAEGSAVSIEFGAENREGEIVSCHSSGSKYEAHISIGNIYKHDLRSADRFPVTQEVQIWTGGSESPLDADVADLSAHGIGLEVSARIETGESVMVESASSLAFGVVHYCRPLDDGRFRAGVEVFHEMPKEAEPAA